MVLAAGSSAEALSEVPTNDAPYHDSSLSPVLTGGLGLGPIGDDLVGELGGRALGLATVGRRWLLQWDGLVAFRGGVLASTNPFASFFGGTGHGFAELGHRFQPEGSWSGYLGARLAANLQVMAHPGVALSLLSTLNNSDGFGGVTLDGAVRIAGGVSLIDGGVSRIEDTRSLLLVVFLQEALIAPGLVTAGAAFTELGLGARFDLVRSFTGSLEVLVGSTPALTNQALQLTDETIRVQVGGELRKTFGNGVWLGVAVSYTRDSDHLVYTAPGGTRAYDSAHPGMLAATISLGVALGRSP